MTRDELDHLDDHDLLVLLHERLRGHDDRLRAHEQAHRDGVSTFRWTVIAILTAMSVLVLAATAIATNGIH